MLGDPQEDVDPSLCGPGSVPSLECQAYTRMSRGLRSENPCCVSPALLEPSITLYACRMPAVPCHRRSSALARQQCPSVGPMAARRGGDLRLPTAQVAYLSIPPTLAHCNRLSRPPRPDMCIIAKVNTCTRGRTPAPAITLRTDGVMLFLATRMTVWLCLPLEVEGVSSRVRAALFRSERLPCARAYI